MTAVSLANEITLVAKGLVKADCSDLNVAHGLKHCVPALILKGVPSVSLIHRKAIEKVLCLEVVVTNHMLEVTSCLQGSSKLE